MLGYNKDSGIQDAQNMLNASDMLNIMMKSWQSEGMGLWLNKEVTLFMQKGTVSFDIGPTGDHATLTPYDTELADDADTGDLTITVDSDDDITDGDYIGIELDSGSFQFTTVNGTPSSDVVALTDVLTGDTSENKFVINYTTKIQRPLEILEARRRNDNENDVPLNIYSRNEYMELSNKTTAGTPNCIFYDPQLTNGKMYVWQPTNDVGNRIVFTAKYPIEIFDSYDDSTPFPDEWLLALRYNLAVFLYPEYINELENKNIINVISVQASDLKEKLLSFDAGTASFFMQPNLRGY